LKKITIESLKVVFAEYNCILLEEVYSGNQQPLKFKCYCGKEDIKNLATFNKNPKCRFCAYRNNGKTKSFDEIKNIFESKGIKLLSTEYIPGKKLEYICDCGKYDSKIIHHFISGRRCVECGLKKNAASRRLSQEYVESIFEENGCKLLSQYDGDQQRLEYICKCGKVAKTKFHTFKKCKNCRECGNKKNLLNLDIIYKFVKDNKLDLISLHSFETSSKGKLLFRCDCGNEYERTWNYVREKKGNDSCVACSKKQKIEKMTGENHPCWIKDRGMVEFRKQYAKKIYSMLRRCYLKFNLKKEDKSFESLGYSHYDLGLHISNHPNYQNAIKNNNMHIDHIFPIQAFIDFGLCETEHVKIINSLENLQPMDAIENMSKNDKYDRKAFIQFLTSKGIYLETEREYNF
jgi:hypothetical protein